MPYTAATPETFRSRFPAFAQLSDALVTGALTRARRIVDETWCEDDRQEAEHLLAAHELTLDGHGATREAQLQGFKRLKLGSLELEREAGAASVSGTYGLTSFGQRFLDLLRVNKPAILVIGAP